MPKLTHEQKVARRAVAIIDEARRSVPNRLGLSVFNVSEAAARRELERERAAGFWIFMAWLLGMVVGLFLIPSVNAEELSYIDSHALINEYAATEEHPPLYWASPTTLRKYVAEGQPTYDNALTYSLWSWVSRTNAPITDGGSVSSIVEGGSGYITVTYISSQDMYNMTGSSAVEGRTRTWFYASTGKIAGAIIYLLDSHYDDGMADKCATQITMHELGHALGGEHTSNSEDVMYSHGATGCRYSLSYNDMASVQYSINDCYAELTKEGDIYVPMIEGKAVELVHNGSYQWGLGSFSDSLSTCSTVSVDSGMNITLTDLRGQGVSYSHVLLAPVADNTWVLDSAE